MPQTFHDAPAWFRRALDVPYTDCNTTVDGAGIHYLAWGEPGRPGLVFVHGGAAHAHWWTHVAAQFAAVYRVVAIDLSGHGDSDRRDEYSLDRWCSEVMAVADDADMAGAPIVIGHSMGGLVTLATASAHGDRIAGAVVMDSPVAAPDPEMESGRRNQFRDPKVYPDTATAIGRFRTVPEQDHYEPYVMDHVAAMSLRPTDGGVTWKFDPRIFMPRRSAANELLPDITCRVALFRAEHGLVTPGIGAYMYEQLGRVAPVIEIPLAGHHLMLDQPLLVVTALRTLFADWEHSVPFERD
jgi:pimeloyl-ACP methyl ester carboxylesterase|tara:strand:- start:2529 stop:3419 length:891 start_codon:yes stop_codon:yes gene_type:complete